MLSQMGQPEALLIFGPGEAKLQLRERVSNSKVLSELAVEIESTDKLTDPEIVAHVKKHYGIRIFRFWILIGHAEGGTRTSTRSCDRQPLKLVDLLC